MTGSDQDVLVIGGGPAGATAAKLLADWGHSVRLVARAAGESRLAESLPPSCGKLFHTLGVDEAIERAAFIRSTGNTVWWGSETTRVERFADGARGWQVEAQTLAEVLIAEAARAGAVIEPGVYTFEGPPRADPRPLTHRSGGSKDPPAPTFTLDCSGRSGVLARACRVREYDEGPRTVALVASWCAARDWNIPDATHTVVESYESGWAWSVPTAPLRRHIAVMVDPQRSGLVRGGSSRDIYLTEIVKTREFRSLVRAATIDAGPWGWDASTYHATRYAGDDWLLVGDAGSFIDPLSSAGVKKALASGWLAAVVTHTCLVKPAMRAHALTFFEDRERRVHHRFAAMTRRMLGDAAAGHGHRFWADRWDENTADGRRQTADDRWQTADDGWQQLPSLSGAPLSSGGEQTEDGDQDVRVAFERLRQSRVFAVRRAPGLVIEPRPAVSGSEIVLEERIVDAPKSSGVRFVRDVDVVTLIDLAPHHDDVARLFEAYGRARGPVALPDFLRALATAVARGWLVAE